MAAGYTTMAAPDTRRARIAEINQQIAQLQAERDLLVDSLTFPVISLPVEITSQIFLHCIPDDPLRSDDPFNAVVLGHICRQWRDIALALPDLWSGWSLAIDGNSSRTRLETGLKFWLARSQARPLPIRVHHRDGTGPDVSQVELWWKRVGYFGIALLPTIGSQHRRWKTLELNVPLTVLRGLSKILPDDRLPYLTHLLLGSVEEDLLANADTDEDSITMFADAPQLRSLHLVLEARRNLDRMGHVQLPYAQLTHFTGTFFSAHECLVILARMPLLVECVFYVSRHTTAVHHVSAPSLKSLKLFSATPDAHPVTVLDDLTLPALETLVLGREEADMAQMFTFFVRRSECAIRHFSCQSMEGEELASCLEDMPVLATLDLFDYDQHGIADVLRHLKYQLGAPPEQLVPGLQGITIRCQKQGVGHAVEFSYNAVLELLERMAKRPTPPKRFRLVWTTSLLPRRPNDSDVHRFQELVQDGIEVHVGTEEHSWIPASSLHP
ncbi:hypothetical protein C8R47DRAFT_1165415 [Mycena vitilis]|nr:hypothetical protein C8R47DRAFT_1165415 [Mycena vitilis]